MINNETPVREVDVLSTMGFVVKRYRWLLVAALIAGAMVGYAIAALQPEVYATTSRVFLRSGSTALGTSRPLSANELRVEAALASSSLVAERAATQLGGGATPAKVRASVTAAVLPELGALNIRAERPFPGEAARYANAVATAYEAEKSAQVAAESAEALRELESARTRLAARIAELEAQRDVAQGDTGIRAQLQAVTSQLTSVETSIDRLTLTEALGDTGVDLIEPAPEPQSAIENDVLQSTAAGAIVALLLATGVAWWRSERSPVVRRREDPARVLDAPLLGDIPRYGFGGDNGEIVTADAPNSIPSEAYEFLVSSLRFALRDRGIEAGMLAVTSTDVGDGKTLTIANLGVVAARDGRRPLLVDADERARGLSQLVGLGAAPGLTDLIERDDGALGDVLGSWEPADGIAIPVIPAGTPLESGTAGLFRHARFTKVMIELREHGDVALVDAPPVGVAETMDIVAQADGVVLVVRPATRVDRLREARRRIEMSGTPLVGYVYNGSGGRRSRYEAAYGYGSSGRSETPADR